MRCIRDMWRCDGDIDCLDGSDEKDCPSEPPRGDLCQATDFTCGNHDCIHKSWRCDGDVDCADGTDEEGCGIMECAGNQFRCNNNQCIPGSLQCDGQADCTDESDEKDCGKLTDYLFVRTFA